MFILLNIFISASIALIATIGGYNYIPLSFIEHFGPETPLKLGATITTINATDTIRDSRAVINTNFINLNTDKIEVATTSIGNITTLPNLVSIGTITTGVWTGTTIAVANGGTGSTTLASNRVLLGNGTTFVKNVADGTSGQFLTFQGTGNAPTWTTAAVDQALNYTWTGNHIFTRATTTNATTTILYANSAYISSSTIATTTVGALNATSSITSRGDLTSFGAFHSVGTATSTFGSGIKLTTGCFETVGGCLGGGYETISATQALDTSDNQDTTATATCNAGKKVIGGGMQNTAAITVETSAYWFSYSYPPDSTSWTGRMRCNTGATCPSGNLVVYAICINN